MRTEVKDRFYRVFTYRSCDRVPDISYSNYCYYLQKKRKLIGKA